MMREFNTEHEIETKGIGKERLTIVAVITDDSLDKPYTEIERSYAFTNDNKALMQNMGGYSIFSWCLNGKDNGVRLERYVGDAWKVDYCYVLED